MRRVVGRILAWIGGIVVLVVALTVVVALVASSKKKVVPAQTLLEVDFERAIGEDMSDDPVAKLAERGSKLDLRDVLDALEAAENDPKVVGLVARVGAAPIGMAHIQELREAVERFRKKGKFALAFGETYGEFAAANGAYYLATAFDEIWLQPSGDVGWNGLLMESPFLRGALDKLGVKPRLDQRYEYKNAMNMFTEAKFTPAHREAIEKVASSMFGQIVRAVAASRKLSEPEVRALVDRGPFLGPEALKEKLVDRLGYHDEFYAHAKERAGNTAQLLYLSKYLERIERPNANKKGKVIALIYGRGGVQRGKSDSNPFSGSDSMGSDTVSAAFRKATRDSEVKAILFRVDSPGGSYVASDTIWREVVRARAAGKPVIVSMGNVAGSGGYFVAMAADKIVAEPATITGSIGVLGGKMVPTELLEGKLGITYDRVALGQNATMFSMNRDYSDAEWKRLQAWLDRVYQDFTTKVAEGRKLPPGKVLEVAKGRIWTGEDAKQLGLVDELGGFRTALELTKQAAGIPDSDPVQLRPYPLKKKLIQELLAELGGGDEDGDSSESQSKKTFGARILKSIQVLALFAEQLGIASEREELAMPVVPSPQ